MCAENKFSAIPGAAQPPQIHTHKSLLLLTLFMCVALFPIFTFTINLNHVLCLIFNSWDSLHKSIYCDGLYLAGFMYVNEPSTLTDFIKYNMHLIYRVAEFAFSLEGCISPSQSSSSMVVLMQSLTAKV